MWLLNGFLLHVQEWKCAKISLFPQLKVTVLLLFQLNLWRSSRHGAYRRGMNIYFTTQTKWSWSVSSSKTRFSLSRHVNPLSYTEARSLGPMLQACGPSTAYLPHTILPFKSTLNLMRLLPQCLWVCHFALTHPRVYRLCLYLTLSPLPLSTTRSVSTLFLLGRGFWVLFFGQFFVPC